MKTNNESGTMKTKKVLNCISKCCAYRHLFEVIRVLVRGGALNEQMKAGRNIALLGIFCPFFWLALFSGADASTLMLHGSHSAIVFLVGVILMVISLMYPKS
ncbi:hypothetical protein P3T73_14830 [Kiritimatiellota bacterium B12222]|nr:hypothetical protein P3T73_14830 [Kiritimatiellota bacterium B12222]